MRLREMNSLAVCFNCKKKFKTGFEIEFDRWFVSSPKICKNCAKDIYMALGQKLVPKSPKNINFVCKVLKEKDFE